jgi:DNA-binding transcriptional LysR family regulator
MDLYQLRHFLVVAETRNFRRAAEQINLAQPALSRQIQQIEAETGALLFDRSKRRVELTDAGQFFREQLTEWLAQYDRIVRRTGQMHRGEAGELQIGHASSAMQSVLPGLLRKLRDARPDLHTVLLEESNTVLIEGLLNRRIDLALMPNAHLPAPLTAHTLYRENFVLIVPSDFALTGDDRADLRRCTDQPFILPPLTVGSGYVETIRALCREQGFVPQTAHESAFTASVLRLVEAGLGVAIEPKSSLGGVSLQLKWVELISASQQAEMQLVWHRDRDAELQPLLKLLVDDEAV